jgi:hypothetical protein
MAQVESLYADEAAILERIEARVAGPYGLREVYAAATLPQQAGQMVTPSVAVVSTPFRVQTADTCGEVLLQARWQVVACERAYNDRGRADRARDEAGRLAVACIQALSAWAPVPGRPLVLVAAPGRLYRAGVIFVPLVFGNFIHITASED